MAFMQIMISPRVPEGGHLSPYIAEIHKYLAKTKFPHQLHDMGTIIQGKASELLTLAKTLHELPFKKGIKRVYTVIQIDDRRDKKVALGEKVKSVRKKMR